MSKHETTPLKDCVQPAPDDRPQPDQYRARTGHLLILEKSKVLQKIKDIKEYASKMT